MTDGSELGGSQSRDDRLDDGEFRLTPVGRRELHGQRDARDLDPKTYSSSSRAIHEPDSDVVEQTEEATLGGFADAE